MCFRMLQNGEGVQPKRIRDNRPNNYADNNKEEGKGYSHQFHRSGKEFGKDVSAIFVNNSCGRINFYLRRGRLNKFISGKCIPLLSSKHANAHRTTVETSDIPKKKEE